MGQRVIPVAVTAEYIGGDGVTLGAAGSHSNVVIEYDFRSAGPMWEGTTKYVLWTNPQGNSTNRVDLGVDKLVDGYENVYHASPTADAMCVAGWAEMVVVGVTVETITDEDSGETTSKETLKVKTEPSRFRVLPGSSRSSDNEGVAATVADQLQTEIEAVDSRKVNKPVTPYDPNGEEGQVLVSLGGGKTKWTDNPSPTEDMVEAVLEKHKDWVTTVQDGAITERKLADEARGSLLTNICKLDEDAVIVEDLMGKTASQIYEMFDAYVESGLLTKEIAGYASKPIGSASIHPDIQTYVARGWMTAKTAGYVSKQWEMWVDWRDNGTPYVDGEAEEDLTRPIYIYHYEHPIQRTMGASSGATKADRRMLLNGCMHGNEKSSIPALLNLLDKLERQDDALVNRLATDWDIDIVPVVNPWGVDASADTTGEGFFHLREEYTEKRQAFLDLQAYIQTLADETEIAEKTAELEALRPAVRMLDLAAYIGRTNGRYVNINRNADFCWNSGSANRGRLNYKGPSAASEQETKLFPALDVGQRYRLHLDLHSCDYDMPFYFCSDGSKSRRAVQGVGERIANRMRDIYGIDLDTMWRRYTTYANRSIIELAGLNSWPVNVFSHARKSPETGGIIEAQRYDYHSRLFHTETMQRYTSEFLLTCLCEIGEILTDNLPEQEDYRIAASGMRNMVPTARTAWTNMLRSVSDGAPVDLPGYKKRISTVDGIPVTRRTGYIFGVSAMADVRINLQFRPAAEPGVDNGSLTYYSFESNPRRVVFPGNGHVFPYMKQVSNGADTAINPGNVGRTIFPYMFADGLAVSEADTVAADGVTISKADIRVHANTAHVTIFYTYNKSQVTEESNHRFTVCTLPIKPEGTLSIDGLILNSSSGEMVRIGHTVYRGTSSTVYIFAYPGENNYSGQIVKLNFTVPLASYRPTEADNYDEPYIEPDPDEDGGEEPEV